MHLEEIYFSRQTFQGACADKKEVFYPLIQLSSDQEIESFLCSCGHEDSICKHAKLLFESIIYPDNTTISSRFEKSFIRAFMMSLYAHHSHDLGEIDIKTKIDWTLGDNHLVIEGSKKEIAEMQLMIENDEIRDETNSLEFSSLPEVELKAYEAKRPTLDFRFRLSNFNDLSKYLFLKMEKDNPFLEIQPSMKKKGLWELDLTIEKLKISSQITQEVLQDLIMFFDPLLTKTPLFEGSVDEKIELDLDPETLDLKIEKKKRELDKANRQEIGEYVFIPKVGFFRKELDSIFLDKKIDDMAVFFKKYRGHLSSLLKNCTLDEEKKIPSYHLKVHSNGELVVTLHKVGQTVIDPKKDRLFGPYLLHDKKVFFELEGVLFDEIVKTIPKNMLKTFLTKHRAFLALHKGFELHMSCIQENVGYVFEKGLLSFVQKKQEDVKEDVIDCGEYLYIPHLGFYPKASLEGGSKIVSGLCVEENALESFIHENRQDLMLIKGFFTEESPLDNVILSIELSDKGFITTSPLMVLKPGFNEDEVLWLGSYTYTKNKGFCDVPSALKMPVIFSHKSRFGLHELFGLLELLETSFKGRLKIDPRLQIPEKLSMIIEDMSDDKPYLAEGFYVSELGRTPLLYIKKAYEKGERSLCTDAGLLDLTQERFGFLKHIQITSEGRFPLDALSFYKLGLYENLEFAQKLNEHPLIKSLDHEDDKMPLDLSGYTSSLRPYQETGVKWLKNLYRLGLSGLLCDEMGLGKTHQAIAFIAVLANQKTALKTIVVCPTSVLYHWERQLKSYLPQIEVKLYHGQARVFDETKPFCGILLTSYGVLRSDIEMFSKMEFDCAVYDELQIAKNPSSKVYSALNKIQTQIKVGLSGTPIENTIEDLKALFDLILPKLLPKTQEFKEKFLIPIEKNYDKNARLRLNRVTAPFIMRRLKKDVLKDLPEKIETDMLCELSDVQLNIYHQIIREQKDSILSSLMEDKQGTLHVFALLTKLKQLCDHPYLLDKSIDPFQEGVSGKWELFIELLQEARDSGQKVVVFSQYLEMLSLIEKYCKKHKIGYATIRGSSMDRAEQVKKFQEDPKCEIFIGSLLASGVGIDLTAASVVIHYDRWWNPAKEAQATDRVHRIGQSRGVQVFKLITKDTIEERIDWLIKDKLRLIETLSTDEGPEIFKNFTKKELLELVESLS
jgi:SNF2 family DNA or RNA helicase